MRWAGPERGGRRAAPRRGPFKAWPTWQPLEPRTRSEAGRRHFLWRPQRARAPTGRAPRERASELAEPPAAAMGQNDLMGTAEDFADQVRPAGSAGPSPGPPARSLLPRPPSAPSPGFPPGPRPARLHPPGPAPRPRPPPEPAPGPQGRPEAWAVPSLPMPPEGSRPLPQAGPSLLGSPPVPAGGTPKPAPNPASGPSLPSRRPPPGLWVCSRAPASAPSSVGPSSPARPGPS